MRLVLLLAVAALPGLIAVAQAAPEFAVHRSELTDEKAVFATVESPNVVPARSRIGGTVAACRCARATSSRQAR